MIRSINDFIGTFVSDVLPFLKEILPEVKYFVSNFCSFEREGNYFTGDFKQCEIICARKSQDELLMFDDIVE